MRAAILALWLALWAALACGPQHEAQSAAAHAVAVSANEVFPVLQSAYVLDGRAAVDRAVDREDADRLVADVTTAWRPVWRAWDAFAAAHTAWVRSLEGDDLGAVLSAARGAHVAYCALYDVAPVTLPDMPGVRCEP